MQAKQSQAKQNPAKQTRKHSKAKPRKFIQERKSNKPS
jgi:hypothetical protein